MKNIYITWHYTTHGVAYFKHILSEFYLKGLSSNKFLFDNLNQKELNKVFSNPDKKGFIFDEIIYLTAPQDTFDKLSTRRFDYKNNILEDKVIIDNGLKEIYERIINNNNICYCLEKEIEFIKDKYADKLSDFEKTVWRNIQHYSIEEQLKWLQEKSNFKNIYPTQLTKIEFPITDLRDEKQIAKQVSEWTKKYFAKQKEDTQYIVNVSLGSNETQVVWHILAESDQLPAKTRFIKTHDDKSKSADGKRFKLFSIKEIPLKLISDIGKDFKIFHKTKSHNRDLVNKKMATFLNMGFSILLMGERGIGKSQIASEAKKRLTTMNTTFKGEIVEANCASFANDTMAESELFGYKKGAFTDAKEDKEGLIKCAENGILFLDEIHHLSKAVQAKLMKALQTDTYNRLSIRRLGSNKEEKVKDVRLIFATNRTIEELKDCLLPDFYDRIVQYVIEIPPLRDTVKDRKIEWENIWKNLRFGNEVPNEQELIGWLKGLKLYGNYRDLQKIAMYYNAFNKFDEQTQAEIVKEKGIKSSAFEYARNEFEKYHLQKSPNEQNGILVNHNERQPSEMITDFYFKLQEWAVENYQSRKSAAEKLGVTEKTLNNWKNQKSASK